MSYFENINYGLSTDIITSDAPYNSQSLYLPSTIQHNGVNYQSDNSFGYIDQVHEPENSYQYFENGNQPSEEGNQVFSYPVLNQVYVPESQIYKVVHAVEYYGTTYFYESLVDFTVYRFCHTTTYTPPHVVDENTLDVYWPEGNVPIDNMEQYIENTSQYDYQSSFAENLTTENNEYLPPPMNMSPFYSPEMDLDNSSFNNYWNATDVRSQCDIVDDFDRNTRSAIRQENLMHSPEMYQNRYSEDDFTQHEDAVYYERVNYGWSQLRNDFYLEGGSVQNPMQAPLLSQEALDKNAIQAHVKYRKDSMYLTALSGKLYQKQTIPVVEKLPVITEVEDQYPMIDCWNEAIENNKSVVQVNTCTKYSKKLYRSKKIRVSESLTEIKNSNHKDHVIDESIGTFSKTMQRIDSTVRENVFSNRCKKMYKKESILFVENIHLMKEVSNKVVECNRNILKAKQTYSVVEEKVLVKRTENLIRKIILQDNGKMPEIQEAENEDYVEESPNRRASKRKETGPNVKKDAFSVTSMKLHAKDNITVRETDKHLQINETNEIGNKAHLKSFQTEEVNSDTDKDSDGFLDKNENIEKNLFAQENGFLSKTDKIPQAENKNAGNLLYSMGGGKSSMINYDRSSLDECEDTTDLTALAGNSTAENTSLSPLWVEVDLKDSLETATAHESGNETTKVHSQKPKKKRLENFRKFLERLLCCCTKGPT